jgi:hypothetical protein
MERKQIVDIVIFIMHLECYKAAVSERLSRSVYNAICKAEDDIVLVMDFRLGLICSIRSWCDIYSTVAVVTFFYLINHLLHFNASIARMIVDISMDHQYIIVSAEAPVRSLCRTVLMPIRMPTVCLKNITMLLSINYLNIFCWCQYRCICYTLFVLT